MRADGFASHGHRFFGRIAAVPTDAARVLEIDEPADLERARALAPQLDATERPGPGEVDAVVLDFDGTQTDDRAWLAADGTERRPCIAETVWASPRCAGPACQC